MTVLKWPDAFDWPYAGQPHDVPPQFARSMVKIEDQIYWLLNALKLLNESAISFVGVKPYIDTQDAKTLEDAKEYADEAVSHFNAALNEVEELIKALNAQIAITRNPVTGHNVNLYVALKQMFDMLRPHTITWDELGDSFESWDAMAAWSNENDKCYYDLEMYANILLNDSDEHRTFFTPESHIDRYTPGYYPDIFVNGYNWEDIKVHGFLYSRKGE